jgi:hypothetical protein
LTYQELEDLFTGAGAILNIMADLRGEAGFLIFGDDYDDPSHTLHLIEKGVQETLKNESAASHRAVISQNDGT